MDECRYRYRDRQDLGGYDGLRDEGGIVCDRTATSHNSVLKEKPREKTAEKKDRKTLAAGLDSGPLLKDYGKYECVAHQKNNGVDNRPKNAPNRADIPMFQIPYDEVLEEAPVCRDFFDDGNHGPPSILYRTIFPFERPLFTARRARR